MARNVSSLPLGKLLADGQLASLKGPIYECPNGQRALITNITYFNTSEGALICSTYFKRVTSRQFHRQNVQPFSRLIVQDLTSPVYMDQGDVLEGGTTLAEAVNFFVWGHVKQRTWGNEDV